MEEPLVPAASCPKCDTQVIFLPAYNRGEKVTCKKCGTVFDSATGAEIIPKG